ncbi:type I phosphomannose isomerase catalytic subunit [Staphylococcus canis]|uniref:Mannose-6-phosphate isomerase n=1 Tax=Staphylococcus canis TaxID=2724942 RepID=A0ABS0TBV5_9STAP|nr:type I phosphomannose isomerase catalytic subunit [Staphylococcus canis]MBI5975892.1 class I mannose-6-phosphate isomerase [Staphylococcus canis]
MPLMLEPIFRDKVWGGTQFASFNYQLPSSKVGEVWAVSAKIDAANTITNEPYQYMTLDEVWTKYSKLFGEFPSHHLPLFIKLIDATAPLSIQVHPDDTYAYEHENGNYGKTKCWYVLDASEDAEIIYGTYAETKEELTYKLDHRHFDSLFKHVHVQKGDFFFIPQGTVHSIGQGIVMLEVQQASDVNYRIYDYDRQDLEGETRALHLEEAKAVIHIGDESPNIVPQVEMIENHKCTTFVQNHFVTVVKWEVRGTLNYMKPREFTFVSVIDGEGEVITDGDIFKIRKGDHFILTAEDLDNVFEGEMDIVISYV